MRHREMRLHGCRDTDLYGQAWLPEQAPRGVLVISHGLGEHGGRYAQLGEWLAARGLAAYALDHRGHGRSGGPRANVERFDYLVSDLAVFTGRAQREYPDAPLFVLGHSMGGAIALAFALKYEHVPRGLALSGPALAVEPAPSALRRMLVKALSAWRPGTGGLRLPPAHVSRDAAVVRAYESDPLVFHGSVPVRTLAELFDAMQSLQHHAHELRVPVLVQHGSADRLVPLSATQPIYQRLGLAARRTIRVYEGLYHEIYNEPERDQVMHDLATWFGL
jgi:acylglycerol lipase